MEDVDKERAEIMLWTDESLNRMYQLLERAVLKPLRKKTITKAHGVRRSVIERRLTLKEPQRLLCSS